MRTPLDDDALAAREHGTTYGKWKARTYNPTTIPAKQPHTKQQEPRKFTDRDAFEQWKLGKTDAQIGAAVGVARTTIQKWRGYLELPSVTRTHVDTQKYRLAYMEDGTPYVFVETDEF